MTERAGSTFEELKEVILKGSGTAATQQEIDALVEAGLLELRDGLYYMTDMGEHAAEQFLPVKEVLDSLRRVYVTIDGKKQRGVSAVEAVVALRRAGFTNIPDREPARSELFAAAGYDSARGVSELTRQEVDIIFKDSDKKVL